MRRKGKKDQKKEPMILGVIRQCVSIRTLRNVIRQRDIMTSASKFRPQQYFVVTLFGSPKESKGRPLNWAYTRIVERQVENQVVTNSWLWGAKRLMIFTRIKTVWSAAHSFKNLKLRYLLWYRRTNVLLLFCKWHQAWWTYVLYTVRLFLHAPSINNDLSFDIIIKTKELQPIQPKMQYQMQLMPARRSPHLLHSCMVFLVPFAKFV